MARLETVHSNPMGEVTNPAPLNLLEASFRISFLFPRAAASTRDWRRGTRGRRVLFVLRSGRLACFVLANEGIHQRLGLDNFFSH